jgi:menaquinone-dependent protoporphyrinogen IX oxidase
MGKIAVLYRSKYGSTKQYAEWIAEETGADLFSIPHVAARELSRYDTIIVGGGLYAGGMLGASFLRKTFSALSGKRIIVFSVGASFANEKNLAAIRARLLPPKMLSRVTFFHLRGGLDYRAMNIIDRFAMRILVSMIRHKPEGERDEEEKGILATYGKSVTFVNRATIAPIVQAAMA